MPAGVQRLGAETAGPEELIGSCGIEVALFGFRNPPCALKVCRRPVGPFGLAQQRPTPPGIPTCSAFKMSNIFEGALFGVEGK